LGINDGPFWGCAFSSPGDKLAIAQFVSLKEDVNAMRILVAFEESYRVYQDVIAEAVLAHRPHTEVLTTEQDALQAEVARIDPDLVICSQHEKNAIDVSGIPAWFIVPTGSEHSAELSLGGASSRVEQPGIVEMLWFVDETEKFLQAKRRS
jgi:hypothetical protein